VAAGTVAALENGVSAGRAEPPFSSD
jgi:hypothetical protein